MPLQGEFVLKDNSDQNIENQPQPVEPALKKSAVIPPQKRPIGMFSTLCQYPDGVEFQNQEEGEEVLLLIRRDFITNLPWILMLIIFALFPIIVMFFSFLFPFISLSLNTSIALILFYYLVLFGILLVNFSVWYFNVGLITNIRILDIDVTGILFRNVAETSLDVIHDVNYSQVGSIQSLFDYGNIHVETIADIQNFEFTNTPEPAKITNFISNLLEKNRKDHETT